MNLRLGNPHPYHSNLTMADNTQAKAMKGVRNVRIQIDYQAYLVDFLVLDIPVDKELPLTKSYLENFKSDESEDWMSCFEVWHDEDVSLKNNDWGSEGYEAYKNIEGGEACHSEFKVTTPSERKFTRSFKTKETKRKLSGKFTSDDILKEVGRAIHFDLQPVTHEYLKWSKLSVGEKNAYIERLSKLQVRQIRVPRMQSPYGKLSRIGLEATKNQRKCKRPFSSRIMKTLLHQEDANLKLLRSLPSAWNNIALIMRNKHDLDTLSMDDLYNNLKVYESDIKGKSSSSLNSQNVAFVSSDNSSSTNETVNTAHSISAASSKDQASTASYVDDVMFYFFSNQSNAPQLDYKDLEQINADDFKEMDLKWQVAMLTMRVKRFIG
ncbi:hypothetical protein Tco_0617392 [Tanacetum coccineum]